MLTYIVSRVSLISHIKTSILELLDDISELCIIDSQENTVIHIDKEDDVTFVEQAFIHFRLLESNVQEFSHYLAISHSSSLF